jgi:hypothetical protein
MPSAGKDGAGRNDRINTWILAGAAIVAAIIGGIFLLASPKGPSSDGASSSSTSTTSHPTNSTSTTTSACPSRARAAAALTGDARHPLNQIGLCGWQIAVAGVTVKLAAGECVDYAAGVSISGDIAWTKPTQGGRRSLMKGAGSVESPATVYFGADRRHDC